MLSIIKKTGGRLEELNKIDFGTWINLTSPTREELERVEDETGALMEHLKSALDEDEKPRIDSEAGSTLIIFKIPFRNIEGDISTIPLGIIMTKKSIISVCLHKTKILDAFQRGDVKRMFTNKKTRFMLQLLSRANYYFVSYLDKIESKIDKIEDRLEKSMKNRDILGLMDMEKTLVYFNRATLTNGNVLNKILKGKTIKLYDQDEDILEDIIIENQQALEMTKIHSDILKSMMDAYSSIISNNLNTVMKFLAAFTIILAFPTIVFSFYGMNVSLPFETNPSAFWLSLLMSLILSGTVALIFAKKRWL